MTEDKMILLGIIYVVGVVMSLLAITVDNYIHTQSFKFWKRPMRENIYIFIFVCTSWLLVLFLLVDWVKE